jgi:hypothetical protein
MSTGKEAELRAITVTEYGATPGIAVMPTSSSSPPDLGGCGVTTNEPVAGRERRDVLRAHALLRAGVATVDRVLGHLNNCDADPQVKMALTETSQASHRALVMLTEVREILADLSGDHPSQTPMSEDLRAEALSRLTAN